MNILNLLYFIDKASQYKLIKYNSQIYRFNADGSSLFPNEFIDKIKDTLTQLKDVITIRKMLYGHADTALIPLDEQLDINIKSLTKLKETELNITYIERQLEGLKKIKESMQYYNEKKIEHLDKELLHPNIIIDCSSNGELECKKNHVKVYQTIFGASYGENNYKDVFELNKKIVIWPAEGGKCNVSIGNPYRAVGWFLNYLQQGASDPIIRCWEIPIELFLDFIRTCGTENQVKKHKELLKKPQKDLGKMKSRHVELCDHKAPNQFGLWTHEETENEFDKNLKNYKLNEFGKYFVANSSNLISYKTEKGLINVNKRDGIVRNIKRLYEHLGIEKYVNIKLSDFSTCLSAAEGNLQLSQKNSDSDDIVTSIMDILDITDFNIAKNYIDNLEKIYFIKFANILYANEIKFDPYINRKKYNAEQIKIRHLNYEIKFKDSVYIRNKFYRTLKKVIGLITGNLIKDKFSEDNAKDINKVITVKNMKHIDKLVTEGSINFKGSITNILTFISNQIDINMLEINKSNIHKNNIIIIDLFNLLLRPLFSGSGFFKDTFSAVSTKKDNGNENFKHPLLKNYQFQVGKGQRFDKPDKNLKFQIFYENEIISVLFEKDIPITVGISGTTRDILRYFSYDPKRPNCGCLNNNCNIHLNDKEFGLFFSIIAAFMINYKFHSLSECYIAAMQFYDRDNPIYDAQQFNVNHAVYNKNKQQETFKAVDIYEEIYRLTEPLYV